MKPAVCAGCHATIFDAHEAYERREEIIRLDHAGGRLGVRRLEVLCADCARGTAYRWKGLNPRQGMFPELIPVKED